MKLLDIYIMEFGTYPPLITTVDYETPKYQRLIGEAIKNGKPIDNKDLEAFKDFDLLPPKKSFSKFKK